MHDTMHDVIVVGAGPGGAAAAHYLAARGLDVVLLDKAAFPREKTCGDGLTPRAVGVLDDMGLLPELLPAGRAITGAEIVAPDRSRTVAPIPSPHGLPPMLVVPRLVLDDAIRGRAVRSGAQFEGRVTVTAIDRNGGGVIVHGERDRGDRDNRKHDPQPVSFHARMAMVATGASTALLVRVGLLPAVPRMMLAARTYIEGMAQPADHIQIRFDGVPLPGYGWIFPVSASSSNVGAGYFPAPRVARRMPPNPTAAFERFVASPPLAAAINGARRTGPVKGYPLRVDFPTFPASGDRVLLVGEAAGLVNPLTGEGIDYALESAQIAAEHADRMLAPGNLSRAECEAYDRALRARFERLFVFCRRVRDRLLNPRLLSHLVRVASKRSDLQALLVDIVLGNREVSGRPPLARVLGRFL